MTHTSRVNDLAGFVALAIVVIVTPGPDTALTIRNTLVGGRPAGLATAIGVALGQATWSVATSVGAQSLWSAFRRRPWRPTVDRSVARMRTATALRQGVLSNLTNPNMAVFFPSLLPQFVAADAPPFFTLLALGMLFCLMTLAWLTAYAFAVTRAGDVLRRSAVRRTIEAVTGAVLLAFGIRVALSSR